MTSDEELTARLAALQSRAERLEMKRTIRENDPILDHANAVQALNRERLAAAERDAAALERKDFERYMAKVRRDLAAERGRAERAHKTESLNSYTSADAASIAAENGGLR